MYGQIIAWICARFHLGDARRVTALAEMVWGLINAKAVTFADIGRNMAGPGKPASKITRVFNWCRNELVDPAAVQAVLARTVFEMGGTVIAGERVVTLAMDWHSYNNGAQSSLRICLVTGSRAIPLLWHEIATSDLGGARTEIELGLVRRLIELRPAGLKLLVLLDAGFRDHRLFELLHEAGYFAVRCNSRSVVHTEECCWGPVGDLPVKVNQVVEFGWGYWHTKHLSKARFAGGRITDKKPVRSGSRGRPAAHYKRVRPGLCIVATNLPAEAVCAVELIRGYTRRFEVEHSFRDSKNATLGLDMDHTDLSDAARYARLMCIVALAELICWLVGSEVEARSMHLDLTPSRPRDGRRTLSLVRVGRWGASRIDVNLDRLLHRHLKPAMVEAFRVIGRTWRDPMRRLIASHRARTAVSVPPMPADCRKKANERCAPCTSRRRWRLEEARYERVA